MDRETPTNNLATVVTPDLLSDIGRCFESLALLPGHELPHVDHHRILTRVAKQLGLANEALSSSASPSSSPTCLRTFYERAMEMSADFIIEHYQYSNFAARLWGWTMHGLVPELYSRATSRMAEAGVLFGPDYCDFVAEHAEHLDAAIDPLADLTSFDYFGAKTMAKSYLLKLPLTELGPGTEETTRSPSNREECIAETPQHMFMRVAVALHLSPPKGERREATLDAIVSTYRALSQKRYVHATPTLFHAGLHNQTLASCYLLSITEDSIESIFRSVMRCALVSKASGGVGLNVSNVRARGARIKRTNGRSGGIVPMLTVFNQVARYVDQGGGKRSGAFTVYLEPWHADIEDFLRLSKKTGIEERITRDLFTAVWCCDLFMHRVQNDQMWSLMSPERSPGLADVWGEEFERLYVEYETTGRYVKRMPAKQLWEQMIRAQLETGMPFLLHKDHVNARDNQSHIGIIRGSNLCTEITLYSDKDNIAVCNLASISLSNLARDASDPSEACSSACMPPLELFSPVEGRRRLTINRYDDQCPECNGGFDYVRLFETACLATRNVDHTIDVMSYPLPETERSNRMNRPLGIGVQGLADALARLRLSWTSDKTRLLNRRIFETLYRASLTESSMLAARHGPYETFEGSKVARSILPHDAYDRWIEDFYSSPANDPSANEWIRQRRSAVEQHRYHEPSDTCTDWLYNLVNRGPNGPQMESWHDLRRRISYSGLRNSHRLAPMPTASTAQILGNCESIEPRTSNVYYRRVQSGEFITLNRQLVDDMQKLGLWDEKHRETLIRSRGSVQTMLDLPPELRDVYKTVWEVPQRVLVDLTADRQPFIDQSQSLNLYLDQPDFGRLTNAHFYAWQSGLKTGMYYLRTRPAVEPVQFTVRPSSAPATGANGQSRRQRQSVSALRRSSTFSDLHNLTDYTDVYYDAEKDEISATGVHVAEPDYPSSTVDEDDDESSDNEGCIACQS